jgi:putative flippase GtrA
MQVSRPVAPDDRTLGWIECRESERRSGPLLTYLRAHAAQLSRFVLIGASLAALNLFFLYCFKTLLHFPDPIAAGATYILGTLVHFPAHRWITYNAQHRPIRPQGIRYAVMLVCNFMILQALVALASRLSISPYIAYMASTGCTMVFNFLVMTHIVFAKGPDRG